MGNPLIQNETCSNQSFDLACMSIPDALGQHPSAEPICTSNESGLEGYCNPESDRPNSPLSIFDFPSIEWDCIPGLDATQLASLKSIATNGVRWKHPNRDVNQIYTLHYGGEVESDGNCLFSSVQMLLQLNDGATAVRKLAVKRFLEDYRSGVLNKNHIDTVIKNLYSPDLRSGWGIHIVQEVKLLAKKCERLEMENAIAELVECGMTRDAAAESVFNDRCTRIIDGSSWGRYMSISGCISDEDDIITLQYTEEGLLTVDENSSGSYAAFGDDIAIESIATELSREIFVLQSHGSDAMLDSDFSIFFLPHRPRGNFEVPNPPLFLFMKGTGWCGAGADHYEPIISRPLLENSPCHKPVINL